MEDIKEARCDWMVYRNSNGFALGKQPKFVIRGSTLSEMSIFAEVLTRRWHYRDGVSKDIFVDYERIATFDSMKDYQDEVDRRFIIERDRRINAESFGAVASSLMG
tara:strand:- start:28705 stop:29022 length:318 start_codon:yes stop_codon:yes gene_type:complete